MTFYNNDSWIGYLAEIAIRKCSGCRDNMKCDILHLHNQLSLLMKLQQYFEPIRADLLNSLSEIYNKVEMKLPHSDDRKKDMAIYCNIGRIFLITLSPEALYYGRYVNQLNDSFIAEVIQDSKKSDLKKKARV